MRLKNIKGANEVVNASSYVVQKPEENKGKWNEVFKNSNPIYIEIGMGKGNFIIGMAQKFPNINFVGIEMYDSVLYAAVNKLSEMEETIPNLRLIRMDAELIANVFEKEISRIYLNFSDPWPKARHAKRRLTSTIFLQRYESIFNGEKQIFQKTDNDDLFNFSLESFEENGYTLKNMTRDLYNNMIEDNVQTEYERKFSSHGKNINRVEAYKN